jgi:zinc D-Ala-D-Ala dipeptidase
METPTNTNKIIHHFEMRLIYGLVFLLTSTCLQAQDTLLNQHGLWVINSAKTLRKTTASTPNKVMQNVLQQIPNIHLALQYATPNNFTKQALYPPKTQTTFLRAAAVMALKKVQDSLNIMGLGLKIFDAYRPYSATKKMWQIVPDDRYAANPKNGSGHNRGIAVDVTIINLNTQQELEMGTGFDNFTDTAHHSFTNLAPAILQNRLLLKNLMTHNGFNPLPTEWWHYSLPNAKQYELLNVSFKVLQKLTNNNLRGKN